MEEKRIRDLPKKFRILSSHKGTRALIEIVKLLYEKPERLEEPLNIILREVAVDCDSTEKNIVNNIDTLCKKIQRGNLAYLSKLAGYTIEGKPRVKELIEILTNYFLRNFPK